MTAIILHQPSLPLSLSTKAALSQLSETPPALFSPLPTIDFTSSTEQEAYNLLSLAAHTTGAALISNLTFETPIFSIQRLFDALYSSPTLAARLNATYPKRGVFKYASLDPSKPSGIDEKVTIDLSVARLARIREVDPELVKMLGEDFDNVLTFYTSVENNILPLLMKATSGIAGVDLAPLHRTMNNNLRLIDYFAASSAPEGDGPGPRCGEHRDYGTFTVVFQDGSVGGLEFEIDGKWIPVPGNIDAVASWGWCGAILSNDCIHAAKHRVVRTEPAMSRRTTAVVFAAPDLKVTLSPLEGTVKSGSQGGFAPRIIEGRVSVEEFKEMMGKKWRTREGNEGKEAVVQGAQDRDVIVFSRSARM